MDRDTDFSEYAAGRWHRLVRVGVLLGCDPATAEDLAQATLLRCYVKWRQVARAADRDAYVARIQLNLLRQQRRRRWQRERPVDEPPEQSIADPTALVDEADAVTRALAGLPEAQRRAVVLRYYLHLTEQQIAEVAGIAPGTVKSRLSRALAALASSPGLAALREGH